MYVHRQTYKPKGSFIPAPSRAMYRSSGVFILVFFLYKLFSFHRSSAPHLQSSSLVFDDRIPDCDTPGLQGLDDLLVVLKTGANEAPDKVPPHFNTTLRCVPHYVIYSDLEENIQGHHIHNALKDMNPQIVASHPDFQYYQRLQANGRNAFSSAELVEWSQARNTVSGRDSPGWKLDKWKFLPMAEKAYYEKPDAKWYWFIEGDTYILWRSLLEWLDLYDASRPYYLGMQMMIGEVIFGYGGAGFALSNPAMQALVNHRKQNLEALDSWTGNHWAGDCVLGKALWDAGIPLSFMWPTLLNEQPATLDFDNAFGGSDKNLWCHYAVSYHHVTPGDLVRFSEFERNWHAENGTLLRQKEVFRHYVFPQLSPERIDWDNLSDNVRSEDTTLENCRTICESEPDCYQFSMIGKTCKTGKEIKLGNQEISSDKPTVSGWLMDRVESFMENKDASCRYGEFVSP